MKRRYSFFPVLLFVCAVLFYIFYPSDENRIRRIINSCGKAAASEDIDKFMESVSYNYRDDHGNNYLVLKKRLETAFKRLDNIDIEKNIRKISVSGSLAEADLLVRVLASKGGETGYIIGDAIEAQKIKIFFTKTSYNWLITKVEGITGK